MQFLELVDAFLRHGSERAASHQMFQIANWFDRLCSVETDSRGDFFRLLAPRVSAIRRDIKDASDRVDAPYRDVFTLTVAIAARRFLSTGSNSIEFVKNRAALQILFGARPSGTLRDLLLSFSGASNASSALANELRSAVSLFLANLFHSNFAIDPKRQPQAYLRALLVSLFEKDSASRISQIFREGMRLTSDPKHVVLEIDSYLQKELPILELGLDNRRLLLLSAIQAIDLIDCHDGKWLSAFKLSLILEQEGEPTSDQRLNLQSDQYRIDLYCQLLIEIERLGESKLAVSGVTVKSIACEVLAYWQRRRERELERIVSVSPEEIELAACSLALRACIQRSADPQTEQGFAELLLQHDGVIGRLTYARRIAKTLRGNSNIPKNVRDAFANIEIQSLVRNKLPRNCLVIGLFNITNCDAFVGALHKDDRGGVRYIEPVISRTRSGSQFASAKIFKQQLLIKRAVGKWLSAKPGNESEQDLLHFLEDLKESEKAICKQAHSLFNQALADVFSKVGEALPTVLIIPSGVAWHAQLDYLADAALVRRSESVVFLPSLRNLCEPPSLCFEEIQPTLGLVWFVMSPLENAYFNDFATFSQSHFPNLKIFPNASSICLASAVKECHTVFLLAHGSNVAVMLRDGLFNVDSKFDETGKSCRAIVFCTCESGSWNGLQSQVFDNLDMIAIGPMFALDCALISRLSVVTFSRPLVARTALAVTNRLIRICNGSIQMAQCVRTLKLDVMNSCSQSTTSLPVEAQLELQAVLSMRVFQSWI